MTPDAQLVGYDIRRVVSPALLSHWDASRREKFLLWPDVRYPYSVDGMVWPSRFQLGPQSRYPFPLVDPIVINLANANTHYQLFDLWDDLIQMLGPYRPSPEGDCGLGVGLVRPEFYPGGADFDDEWWLAIHGSPISPPEPKEEWRLIGYDVANSGLTSALANCGYRETELAALRKTWGRSLNEYGLFGEVGDAVRFCADANVRAADEGPFFAFELFLLWSSVPPP